MSRRIAVALVSAIALAVSLLIAAPANATDEIVISDNDDFRPSPALAVQDGPGLGASSAINSSGSRVLFSSAPRGENSCSDPESKLEVYSGTTSVDGTTRWHDPVIISADFGAACRYVYWQKVFISDDGLSGLLVWVTLGDPSQVSQAAIYFSPLSWPATGSLSARGTSRVAFSQDYLNGVAAAMSADGSRAAIEWSTSGVVHYSVIDLETWYSNWTREFIEPIGPGQTGTLNVALSADGEVVAFTTLTGSGHGTPGTVHVFTCTVNCYPSRLKHFSTAQAAATSPFARISLNMNRAGTRVVAGWSQFNDKSAFFTLNPFSEVSPVNVSARVKYMTTGLSSSQSTAALNESGTLLGFTGTSGISVATISSAGVIGNPINYALGIQWIDLRPDSLAYANAVGNIPARWISTSSNLTNKYTLVSDSLTPTNWGVVDASGGGERVDNYQAHQARSSLKSIVSGDSVATGFATQRSFATVETLQNVLTYKTRASLVGAPTVGNAVTFKPSTFTVGGTSITKNWTRTEGFDLDPQPTANTYRPSIASDMGKLLEVSEVVEKPGYYYAAAIARTAVPMSGLQSTITFSITGSSGTAGAPRVGDVLRAASQLSFPGDATVVITWRRGATVVGNGSEYTVGQGDLGKALSATAAISKTYWKSGSKVVSTAKVLARPACFATLLQTSC
jgi:hypothetical protein